MDARLAYELAALNSNMSDVERLVSLHWGLSSVLRAGVAGDVVEIGCNAGYTSVWLATTMLALDPERELVLFDSFAGMPAPGDLDTHLPEGECLASAEQVEHNFRTRSLPMPRVVAGWFDETLSQLPQRVCFGYLDGDHYRSIQLSLEQVWPRLEPGGLLVIDDYCDLSRNERAWDGLPGVKKACDEFFAGTGCAVEVIPGTSDLTLGYVYKPAPQGESR
ncbi:TylF/MycF/NovP-related O-methyltransferase [Plantactinospora sp. KLBMP9567]|uniref:TylF/MycF/NovP-related O-methyltransferase n=1 Tax=Plantactinospora sp. KLBMP9567 TaxID=3085900 RepID=UPI002980F786|nr:TylF/MycF/NovP-related O-methyltransferase [Plantactinospora sp. KLBMP9567]MDW5327068.1 TylF/MycF/NovP-related O-methyltransferase [Plantactinospora sp. KLBMP9567]